MPTPVHPNPLFIHPPADLVQRYPALRRASSDLARRYAEADQLVSDAMLQAVGTQLWQALAQTTAVAQEFDEARQAAGAHSLPLLITSAEAAVQQLPWETLYHPTYGFLGKANGFTLARTLDTTLPTPVATEPGPLRVLIFTTLPDDLDAEKARLDVEEEQAQLLEALTPWVAGGLVALEMPDDGRFSTLQHYLRTFQPHLLFFSGHGNFVEPPLVGQPPYATLLFESETGRGEAIHEEQLANALLGSSVTCVVLSACETAMTGSDALTNGLTWRLSRLGIAHVIGMRESVLDRAGTLFARHFCDAIARRERVDVALQQGRQAITTPLKDSPWLLKHDKASSVLAAQSLGQWCLPLLLTQAPALPLIDWNFAPAPPPKLLPNQTLQSITLPPRFIGRRAELRRLHSRWRQGGLRQLLITGPGGQGKTALAGKLAQTLEGRGYALFAWSARGENAGSDWENFGLELELALSQENAERYTRMAPRYKDESDRAKLLLRLLLAQHHNRLLLFFDNLESLQEPATRALGDARLTAWIGAAQSLTGQGLILLLTSRWQLPGWPDGDHLPLVHAPYGDFLQMARAQLPVAFLQQRDRVRRLYQTLHGNGRGLQFFAAAIQNMNVGEESAFLARLAQATIETQTDMALAQIVAHLTPPAHTLLGRLPAYQTPVPLEGIVKLALDLPEAPALLEQLLAVSLVEAADAPDLQTLEYQISPLVAAWLTAQGAPPPDATLYQAAARYQLYLFHQERRIVAQAIAAHGALHLAGQRDAADRLALDWIVGALNRQGLYETLLSQWLPPICQSPNPQTRGEALGQTGEQHYYLGNYSSALGYFEQSLQIRRETDDKAGEGATLNNLSLIFKAHGEYERALGYLQQSLAIQREIGNKAGEGTTLNNLAGIYRAHSDYDTALGYLQQSLTIQREIGDKANEGAILNNLSQIYDARGEYETALGYLQQSLVIRREIGDKGGEGATLNNLSQIYDARGEYERALGYLQQSLAIQREIGDKAGEGTTLNNLAGIYRARGDYDTALGYLQQSLVIRREIGNKADEGMILNNLSQIFKARGDHETALNYLQQSLHIQQEIGDVAGLCTTLFNMGHIYLQNKDSQAAVEAWVTVYRLAKRIHLAQVLTALTKLADGLGLEGGLAAWEAFSQRMGGEE